MFILLDSRQVGDTKMKHPQFLTIGSSKCGGDVVNQIHQWGAGIKDSPESCAKEEHLEYVG